MNNIHNTFQLINNRLAKQSLMNQRSLVVWITGLSGSGKTTNAVALSQKLHERGFVSQILDGDNIRSGVNSDLGFSGEDRVENIRRVAEVSKLFLNCGIITINCFISPTEETRKIARDIIGKENIFEVYLNTPIEICESRDVKGLYQKARKGLITDFTGINSPYDEPVNSDIIINTDSKTVDETSDLILKKILPLIEI